MRREDQGGVGPIVRLIGDGDVATVLSAWAEFAPRAVFPGRRGDPGEDMATRMARGEPWFKDLHVASPAVRDLGRRIAPYAADLLGGGSVDLWGATVLTKTSGQIHRFHQDAEAYADRCATLWIALDNVTADSSLLLIRGSHRYPVSPQGTPGVDPTDRGAVLALARSIEEHAEIESLGAMQPGFGAGFDALTWHGSALGASAGTRRAATFQYSTRGARIRVPLTFSPPIEWGRDARAVPC